MSSGPTNHFPATVSLCLCSLINAYLMVSVFPYAGFLCVRFIPSANEENAGSYAGLLESSFMLGRTLTSYAWGRTSDRYGRVFALLSSLMLCSIFSLLFGLTKSFYFVMFWRFCLGMSNGILGCAKTVATELADGNERLEHRAMGLVIGMRAWGYLLGPAIGGFLAEPLRQYPTWQFQNRLLTEYPFLLPNLFGSILCIIAAATVYCCIPETLEDNKRTSYGQIPADLLRTLLTTGYGILTRIRSVFLFHEKLASEEVHAVLPSKIDEVQGLEQYIAEPFIWNRLHTRALLLSHWSYSFVSMAADVAFPLFCMSHQSGLGLNGASIGKTLSGAGILFACAQYLVFSTVVQTYGVYNALAIGSMVGIQPCTLIPTALILQDESGKVTWGIFILLAVLMGIVKTASCLYFTSIALSLNKTVPSEQRGRMNGLCNTGSSISRAMAPTTIGLLVSFSFSGFAFPAQFGSIVVYGIISVIGVVIFLRVRTVVEQLGEESQLK
jgi:MFS family permease